MSAIGLAFVGIVCIVSAIGPAFVGIVCIVPPISLTFEEKSCIQEIWVPTYFVSVEYFFLSYFTNQICLIFLVSGFLENYSQTFQTKGRPISDCIYT